MAWGKLVARASAVSRTLRAAARGPGAPWESLHIHSTHPGLCEWRSQHLNYLILGQARWVSNIVLHGGGWTRRQLRMALGILASTQRSVIVHDMSAEEAAWMTNALSPYSVTDMEWSGRYLSALPSSLRRLSISCQDDIAQASTSQHVMQDRVSTLQRLLTLQELKLELDLWQLSEQHMQCLSDSLPSLSNFDIVVSAACPMRRIDAVPDLRGLDIFPARVQLSVKIWRVDRTLASVLGAMRHLELSRVVIIAEELSVMEQDALAACSIGDLTLRLSNPRDRLRQPPPGARVTYRTITGCGWQTAIWRLTEWLIAGEACACAKQ